MLERVGAADRNSSFAVILNYLQRYGSRLFGHPARRDEDGTVLDVVERTNNVLECHFGDDKQKLRRRVGRAHLGRDLQQQPSQVALVSNLSRADYVQVLCGSLDNLPTAIAALDGVRVEGTTPLERDHRDSRLQQRVQQLLQGIEPDDGQPSDHDLHADKEPADCRQSIEPDELMGLSEPELRARCAKVFGADDQAPRVTAGKSTHAPKASPRNTPKTESLGKLHKRMASDLEAAGYNPASRRAFLVYARQFASFHRCSPLNLGSDHVVAYLRHLVLGRNVSLSTYRTARISLVFLYAVTLQRPEDVDQLPLNPDDLIKGPPKPNPPAGLCGKPGHFTRLSEAGGPAAPVS